MGQNVAQALKCRRNISSARSGVARRALRFDDGIRSGDMRVQSREAKSEYRRRSSGLRLL